MLAKYDYLSKLDKYREYGPLVLRVVVGVIMFAHGYSKFTGGVDKVAGFFGSIGIMMPLFNAWFITLLEMVGGAILVLGFASRYLGLLFAADMLVAIWKVHFKNGLTGQGGYEFTLILMAASLCLMLVGGGAFSLDNLLCGKKHKK